MACASLSKVRVLTTDIANLFAVGLDELEAALAEPRVIGFAAYALSGEEEVKEKVFYLFHGYLLYNWRD